jgi:hypothetical protein
MSSGIRFLAGGIRKAVSVFRDGGECRVTAHHGDQYSDDDEGRHEDDVRYRPVPKKAAIDDRVIQWIVGEIAPSPGFRAASRAGTRIRLRFVGLSVRQGVAVNRRIHAIFGGNADDHARRPQRVHAPVKRIAENQPAESAQTSAPRNRPIWV